ncbi:MAG: TIGR04141 family sporadically distributed protein [Trebonia sp.]
MLGPDNELIHVKRAAGSAPLSHLFSQGLVSAQSLVTGPVTVRERFVAMVSELPRGRVLPPDFTPAKVVYGILRPPTCTTGHSGVTCPMTSGDTAAWPHGPDLSVVARIRTWS